MHILILEAGLTGHHSNYLERIATTFLGEGHRLTISVHQDYFDDPLFYRLHAQYPGQVAVRSIQKRTDWTRIFLRLGVVGSELNHWMMFKRTFEQLNMVDPVDHVFIPYLDYCLHATALLGSPCGDVIWSGICMRPSFHYSSVGVIAPKPKWCGLKEQLFYRLLRQVSLKKLLTIDETLEQYVKRKRPLNAQRLEYVPDPAELTNSFNRDSAREYLGIPAQDFVILVYGAIDSRKGVDHLLNGVRSRQFKKNIKILIMGRQSSAVREKLLIEPMVLSVDRYVDSADEEAGFRAADVVWMGYNAHYAMSGVIVLAAFACKPVLATKDGLIGWMTQRYNLGMAIDCQDPEVVYHSIVDLQMQALDDAREGMMALRGLHSWGMFSLSVLRSLVC